jgi:hypothetical protein
MDEHQLPTIKQRFPALAGIPTNYSGQVCFVLKETGVPIYWGINFCGIFCQIP